VLQSLQQYQELDELSNIDVVMFIDVINVKKIIINVNKRVY